MGDDVATMSVTRWRWVLLSLTFALACGPVAAAPDVEPVFHHAIVQLDGDGHGLLVAEAPIAVSEPIAMQFPKARRQSACCKRMAATGFVLARDDSVLVTDVIGGQELFVYRFQAPPGWASEPFVGIAAVGVARKTRNAGGQLETVDAHGVVHRSSLCVSQEGVHLKRTVGSKVCSHLYLWLGYAVAAPTCP
jgi:hypothetical protein